MALSPVWVAIYAGGRGFRQCGWRHPFVATLTGDMAADMVHKAQAIRAGIGHAMLAGFATSVGETRSIYRQWYW